MEIILMAIGLLLTGVDIPVMTGFLYPTYTASQTPVFGIQIQGVVQEFVTKNILDAGYTLDVLSDVLGCILLLIGSWMLIKQSKRYVFCCVLSAVTMILALALRVAPFFINGGVLVVTALILYVAHLVMEIWMEYNIIYATVNISDTYVNKGTNRRVQFLWWIAIFARCFIATLTFVGLNSVNFVYQICVAAVTVLYLIFFLDVRKYIGLLKVYKEGFTSAIVPDYIKETIGVALAWDGLRHVRVRYVDKYNRTQESECLVKEEMAYPVMKAFYQLYHLEYALEGIEMITGDGSEIRFTPDKEANEEEMIEKIMRHKGFIKNTENGTWALLTIKGK